VDRLDYLIRTLTRIDALTGEARGQRRQGLDWPTDGAETMVGVERLENIKNLGLDALARGVPGDFMECGTWKGGAGILMAQILKQSGEGRRLFIADSFEGCPRPDAKYPADANDPHHTFGFLKVPLAEVKANFARYGVGEDAEFMAGWFKETLPGRVCQLALLRIDADMYESTTQCLDALYDLVSVGGYVILDDYHNIANCRAAIDDFRARRNITASIQSVDWCAVYWRVGSEAKRRAA
jgi:O-methyltransferase